MPRMLLYYFHRFGTTPRRYPEYKPPAWERSALHFCIWTLWNAKPSWHYWLSLNVQCNPLKSCNLEKISVPDYIIGISLLTNFEKLNVIRYDLFYLEHAWKCDCWKMFIGKDTCQTYVKSINNFWRDIQARLGGRTKASVRGNLYGAGQFSRENSIETSRRDTRVHANNSLGVALGADNGREKSTPESLFLEAGHQRRRWQQAKDADAIHSEPPEQSRAWLIIWGWRTTLPFVRRVGAVDRRLALPQWRCQRRRVNRRTRDATEGYSRIRKARRARSHASRSLTRFRGEYSGMQPVRNAKGWREPGVTVTLTELWPSSYSWQPEAGKSPSILLRSAALYPFPTITLFEVSHRYIGDFHHTIRITTAQYTFLYLSLFIFNINKTRHIYFLIYFHE